MNELALISREQALEQEVIQLKVKIEKLRLGRRILMNLLALREQQQQVQLRELQMTVSTLQRRNAELRQMLRCRERIPESNCHRSDFQNEQ